MTSVQNRLLRSNGSNWIAVLLLTAFISSCGIFSESRTHKRPNTTRQPRKPVKQTDPIRIDTIEWDEPVVEIPRVEEDPYDKYGSVFKQQYTIALILPLDSKNNYQDLQQMQSDIGYRFINYYGGIQLALEQLKTAGVDLQVETIKSALRDNDAVSYFNRLNQLNPDLIIGPYDRDLLKELILYGKRKEIPVISPWQSSSKLTEENPYYLQLKPDIKRFFQEIVTHVDRHFVPGQVYLVGRQNNDQELARLNYIQEVHLAGDNLSRVKEAYSVFHVNEDSLSIGETAFDSLFQDQLYQEIAVILPNWSYRDEQFIYSCLRKLNAEKGDVKVTVYGLPIMLESEKIEYNLYKNLNLHIATDNYVNKHLKEVQDFRNKYFDRFHVLPEDAALEGYDMMLFITQNLLRYGNKFQYFLPESYQELLQTAYFIEPVVSEENLLNERYDAVEYFENVHVRIVEFNYDGFITSE